MNFPPPKKSLGQHFLLEPKLNDMIAHHAVKDGLEQAAILELGAGSGTLTRSLLRYPIAKLFAVECDKRMIECLQSLQEQDDRLTILLQDAMLLEWPSITDHRPLVVTGNLPYHIAVPLIMTMRCHYKMFSRLVFVVQEEIAQRLMASVGTKSYGRVSVLAQLQWRIERNKRIPRRAFKPPPKVESVLISMFPQESPLSREEDLSLDNLLRHAFGQRRKMLRNSLKELDLSEDATDDMLQRAGVSGDRRPDAVTIDEFCALARLYHGIRKSES